jgi:hypothetical protein
MIGVHSPTEKINFFYTPKCACTLGRQLWYHLHGADQIGGAPPNFHDMVGQFPPASASSRGYALTRNPYDRAVSMYTNLLCRRYVPVVYNIIKKGMGDVPLTFFNFCQFLLEVKHKNWTNVEYHLYPQTLTMLKAIPRDSLSNEDLLIIRCAGVHSDLESRQNPNKYLFDQYKEAYYKLTGSRRFDVLIDQFSTMSCFNNTTPRLSKFEDDASQIEMVGWEEFPPTESFLTPATRDLIAQIYADDFELLGYPLTVGTDSAAAPSES